MYQLKLYRGEIVGLYDVDNEANQCLAELMAGNLQPEGGIMYLFGQEYRPARLDDAIRSNVGYIPGYPLPEPCLSHELC